MEHDLTSGQRLALRALADGTLERVDREWIVAGPDEAQMLSDATVRWMLGEGLLAKLAGYGPDRPHYRLSERGRRVAADALDAAAALDRATDVADSLDGVPVLLVAPADHSEELDWLLAIPLGPTERTQHWQRLEGLQPWLARAGERFEFVQYADEVYALPIGPRLADAQLMPKADTNVQLVPGGVADAAGLGARRCTDRGVNYGPDWVQWFGGFDRESPLIVSFRITQSQLKDVLALSGDGSGGGRADESTLSPAAVYAHSDPQAEWDRDRARCPVRHREAGAWDVLGHSEMLEVLHDHATFSNEVSVHLSVPNGMDPPTHGPYRRIIERYFDEAEMRAFEPTCRRVAVELLEPWIAQGGGDAMAAVGTPFAVRIQCAFMGWPDKMQDALAAWQDANHRASRAQDKSATGEVARAFEAHVSKILADRRRLGSEAPDDPTTRLLRERVFDRPLREAEIVSIIRNWTAGELGTIAASLGILVHALAHDPELQDRLRDEPARIPAFTDESLRARGPLVANRRVATRDVEVGGRAIREGERVHLIWPAANRDPRTFEEPEAIRLDREPDANLLYGAGIHVCPGAPLARLELRVAIEELLARTSSIAPDPGRTATYAEPPKGGFEVVPVRVS